MPVIAVVGTMWGDEGKGRVIDALARQADWVIRFQGGDNAGHTIHNAFGKHILHLIPSGIFHPHTHNLIGTGCVINPWTLMQELQALEAQGVDTSRLWISFRAHMVLPYHRLRDALQEQRGGAHALGTTKRGIGPAYSDKAARIGLRIGDLLHPQWLRQRLEAALDRVNPLLQTLGAAPVDFHALWDQLMEFREALAHRIVDPIPLMRNALKENQTLLLEGQLGVMRDLDWGIYPYVTSSHPLASYAACGVGLPLGSVDRVIGVVKAYSTAVGGGPFPVELHDEMGQRLRDIGGEYGATTGRPRRCGWLDLVAVRYALWLNNVTELALTKLDVLDVFDSIPVCVGYRLPDGTIVTDTMPDTPILEQVEPIYEVLPGWKTSTRQVRRWQDLPPNAQAYVRFLEEQLGAPVRYISVGPQRDQMFQR